MSITKKEFMDNLDRVFKALSDEVENNDPVGTMIIFAPRTREQVDSGEDVPLGFLSNIKDPAMLEVGLANSLVGLTNIPRYKDMLEEIKKGYKDADEYYSAALVAGRIFQTLALSTSDTVRTTSALLAQLFESNALKDRNYLFVSLPNNLADDNNFAWNAEKNSGMVTGIQDVYEFCRTISTVILSWCMKHNESVEKIADLIHADCMMARVEISGDNNGKDSNA